MNIYDVNISTQMQHWCFSRARFFAPLNYTVHTHTRTIEIKMKWICVMCDRMSSSLAFVSAAAAEKNTNNIFLSSSQFFCSLMSFVTNGHSSENVEEKNAITFARIYIFTLVYILSSFSSKSFSCVFICIANDWKKVCLFNNKFGTHEILFIPYYCWIFSLQCASVLFITSFLLTSPRLECFTKNFLITNQYQLHVIVVVFVILLVVIRTK